MTGPAGTGVRRAGLLRALPVLLVLAVVVLGLVLIAVDRWRRGASALGAASALAGVLRLVLPESAVGPLAVRSRTFDVLFSALLTAAAALLVLL